jgi:serine protease Do
LRWKGLKAATLLARGLRLFCLLSFVCVAGLCAPLARAGVTSELQRAVRASTFEVVLKKPTHDPLTYEKPLPLELLPYKERTDLYRPIGTAFALGANSYVTAAHVLLLAIDSQYGAPMVRSADGQVYAIKSIVKFSAHEDFAVFSLAPDPAPAALETNRTPKVDDSVFAIGNALGEGIVIRDGLFTSRTPEAQDGRWQWIRFSAAASPGNSGGPLLDQAGRVIGLITAKSPNENLNYALPVANILDAPAGKARVDLRILTSLPFMRSTRTYNLKDEFDLPLDWQAFGRAYQGLVDRNDAAARKQLLAAYAESLFPKGAGSESVIYEVRTSSREPGVLIQQPNGQWTVQTVQFDFTDLPQDGRVGKSAVPGATLLRLERSAEAADDAFYGDSKAFIDLAAQALDVRRQVGTDSVRVTSIGPALSETLWADRYGRKWQLGVWALPFMDAYVVGLLLPTPDGYVALMAYTHSSFLREGKDSLTLLADQVTTPYEGTLPQWQAYLRRRALLPRSLEHVSLGSTPNWHLTTPRFEMGVPSSVMTLDAHSRIILTMGFVPTGSEVTWDVVGAWWYRDRQEKAYVGAWRQPRPPSTAKSELRDAFADLQARRSPYDGVPVRESSDAFTVSTMIQAPGSKPGTASSDVVYGLSLQSDGQVLPDRVSRLGQNMVEATRVLEHGVGSDVTQSTVPNFASSFENELERARQEVSRYDDQIGKDIRGRTLSRDFDDYLFAMARSVEESGTIADGANGSSAGARAITPADYYGEWTRRSEALQTYWYQVPFLEHNREVWPAFLAHNRLPPATPHSQKVLDAESLLKSELSQHPPEPAWGQRARELTDAYIAERRQLATTIKRDPDLSFRSRRTDCPKAAEQSSGKDKPFIEPPRRSLEEYYPTTDRRLGIEGSVVLVIRIDSSGCATAAAVVGSSGVDALDQAALEFYESLSFRPAERSGQRIDSETPLAIAFALSDLQGLVPNIAPAPKAPPEGAKGSPPGTAAENKLNH